MVTRRDDSESYARHRTKMAERMLELRRAGSELGEIPPVGDPERRTKCGDSLRLFCETYRPEAFFLEWSPDHLRVLGTLERTVRHGGLFAVAMPRGSGKTTLAVTAALWALLYGYRRWVCLIGATESRAERELLQGIKSELRFNGLLLEDFPEVCVPIAALEGKAARANGQTFGGVPTSIGWLVNRLTLPTVAGSVASGAIVSVCGITGDIRGQQHTTQDGEVIRPDYVLPDDPQTRDSATSQQQTADRLAILAGDILGLAGPLTKIAGVMPCTVIQRGDMADQLLDRERFPEWHGERTQLVHGWPPKNMTLWHEYQEQREFAWRNSLDADELAGKFVDAHYAELHDGVEAAWIGRKSEHHRSALQYAMDLFFRNPEAFMSEYMNQPIADQNAQGLLSEEEIASRVGPLARGVVPAEAEWLTAGVDIQGELLYWCAVAWTRDFTGSVVDYGAYPDQGTTNFFMASAKRTFSSKWPALSADGRHRKALDELLTQLYARDWARDGDGSPVGLQRTLVDANWGQVRNLVYQVARHRGKQGVFPALGRGIGPSSQPLNAAGTVRKLGRTIGTHWRSERPGDAPTRHVMFDTNYWKSVTHARLSTAPGEPGSLVLYRADPHIHRTFAAHQRAEYPTRTTGLNREVDVWKLRPDKPDNHWFDCLVQCCVAASMLGAIVPGDTPRKRPEQAQESTRPARVKVSTL